MFTILYECWFLLFYRRLIFFFSYFKQQSCFNQLSFNSSTGAALSVFLLDDVPNKGDLLFLRSEKAFCLLMLFGFARSSARKEATPRLLPVFCAPSFFAGRGKRDSPSVILHIFQIFLSVRLSFVLPILCTTRDLIMPI